MARVKCPNPGYAVAGLLLTLVHGAAYAATSSGGAGINDALAPRALVQPVHRATLSSEIDGRITAMPFHSGDRFHKGDLLVRFDCTIDHAREQAAQAQLTQAREKLKNDRQLAKLNSIGNLDVALAKADVQKASAELHMAAARVSGCEIRAPYDGRVVKRAAHVHESIPTGRPLLKILDDTDFTIELIVPSSALAWLRPGQKFQLHIDDTGRNYPAHIAVIGAEIDPVSQSIKVHGKIDGSTAGLIAGMSGSARFPHDNNGKP